MSALVHPNARIDGDAGSVAVWRRRLRIAVCSAPVVPGALFLGFALGDGILVAAATAAATGAAGVALVHKAVERIEQHYAKPARGKAQA